jgi:non-ribosomal peptide synthetase component F/acyl carrier protein/aryl carrier-like protein
MVAYQPVNPSNDGGDGTLEGLIQQRLRAVGGARRVIGEADRDGPLPLSAGQQQMWFLHQFDPMSPAYLVTWVLRLSGPLEVEGLRWAWERIVERHEILRTRYQRHGNDPVQVIDPAARFTVRTIDVTGERAGRREDRARQIAEWERRRPFDLTTEWPVRVTLITAGRELHLLVINVHHIACDGPPHIAAELAELYAAYVEGRPASLLPVKTQYADFAAWELDGKSNGRLRPHLDYWRRALGDVTMLPLPLDRPRPARPDGRGGTVEVVIKPETADAVRALGAEHRASPYVVLLAVYHALLADLARSPDVTVGVPVSLRTVPELNDVIGYLVNTIVVRSRHAGHDTFEDLLAQVRKQFLDAFDHRAAPFAWVVDEVNPVREGVANPLFQASFDMNVIDEGVFRLAGLRTEQPGFLSSPAAKFDLTLHVDESSDGQLSGGLEYATALIDEQTAQAWAAYFEALLDAVIREPGQPLSRVHERLRADRRGPSHVAPAAPAAPAAPVVPGGAAAGDAAIQPDPRTAEIAETAETSGSGGTDGRERLLAMVHRTWCEVLGLDDVGVRDNFFDVGGDSLRAVSLAGRLRADGLDVSATDIFAYQTIEELVAARAGQPGGPGTPGGPAPHVAPFALVSDEDRDILPPGVVDAYPLAAVQLGMIVEMRSRPDVNSYQDTTSFLIRDQGAFDAAALRRAVQLVVDRHEVLRTSFDLNGYSVPLQLVHDSATITVEVANYGTLGPDGWMPRLKEYAASERRSPMDLTHAPLIRVHAHTADGSPEWWITITECHPIIEGWSFHNMLMEILTGYQEIRAGRAPAELEPIQFRYADYIAFEAAALRSEQDREYWRGVVEGRVDAMLPSAWQADPQAAPERYQEFVYYGDLEADLRRLASETRTSMKAVMLAAHLKVLSMICGAQDFFTGLVCDTRPEAVSADRVLGMYLNTLPFAMPAGTRTWGELVRAVYDGLTAMWPHRVFPMQVIQKEFGHGDRLLGIFFNYLDFRQVDQDLIDGDQTYNDNVNEFALHVFTVPGGVRVNTTTRCLSRPAASRLLALYRAVLAEMTLGPDGDADSPCLPGQERARVRFPGEGRAPVREPATVLESFTRALRHHPHAPAVRCGAESLTYEQLNARAETVARELRRSGAGPGSLVAVVPARDAGLPADLLGIWMAGAAWIPLAHAPGAEHLAVLSGFPRLTSGIACVLPAGPAPVGPALVGPALVGPALIGPALVGPGTGATGAMFSHRAVAEALEGMREGLEALGVAPARDAAWVGMAPLTSCRALTELLAPLVCGGTAVITSTALPEAIGEARELVAAGSAIRVQSTPLVTELMLTSGPAVGVVAIIDGDRPAATTVTVAAVGAGQRQIPALGVEALPGWVAFAGRPLPGVRARVLDAELRPVPAGVVGELCLSGAAMAEGFYADPARTAEYFVPDPEGDGGSRLYRTGRLARLADDGTLEELGPIEPAAGVDGLQNELYRTRELLNTHPCVRDSHVRLRSGSPSDRRRLIGYVRTVPDASFAPDELRRYLADQKLPRRLIPDVLSELDSWPLDEHGLIDADRLPEPPGDDGHQGAGERPWDDPFDALLRDALAAGHYHGELTPDLALADAGLDSFGFVGLLVALEQAYSITIPDDFPIIDMFRTPRTLWETVADLRAATPG